MIWCAWRDSKQSPLLRLATRVGLAICHPFRPGIGRHAVGENAQCDGTNDNAFYDRFAGKMLIGNDHKKHDTGEPPGPKPGQKKFRLPIFAAAGQGQDVGQHAYHGKAQY